VEGLAGDSSGEHRTGEHWTGEHWTGEHWTGMPVEDWSRTLPAKLEPSDVLEVGFALPLDLQDVEFPVWIRAQSGHQWFEKRRQVKYSFEPGGLASMSIR
jgi:hypothetical protein